MVWVCFIPDISQGTLLGKIYFDHNGRTERTLVGFGNHSDDQTVKNFDGRWFMVDNYEPRC